MDFKALSTTIIDALAALPSDTPAHTRSITVEELIGAHVRAHAKAISHVRDYGAFLREVGFAKAAVKKLAPAFKAISGNEASEISATAAEGLLASLREVRGTLPTQRTEK